MKTATYACSSRGSARAAAAFQNDIVRASCSGSLAAIVQRTFKIRDHGPGIDMAGKRAVRNVRRGVVYSVMTAICMMTAIAGCASHPGTTDDQGAQAYARYCAACHGADARGGGPIADMLEGEAPDLTLIARRRNGVYSRAEIAGIVDGTHPQGTHKNREMPIWGWLLDPDQAQPIIHDLTVYLESVQR